MPESDRDSLEDVFDLVRRCPPWADYFQDFATPHAHFTPAQYRASAERNGFRVVDVTDRGHAWDFGSRETFAGWCRATFVAWVHRLPVAVQDRFLAEALDAYRMVAAETPQEAHTFKFHQMDVELAV